MRNLLLIASLSLLLISSGEAQTWDHFWHPRQPEVSMTPKAVGVETETAPPIVEFLPSLPIIATEFRPVTGEPWQVAAFSAAGPGLTIAWATQINGVNYVKYAITGALLISADTKIVPNFRPSGALMFGFLNGLVNVGGKYEFSKRPDGGSQYQLLIGVNYFPTLN